MLTLLATTSAHATMPMLTPSPKPATPTACKRWAAKQDADAIDMWGIQADGSSSRAVALRRLADSCMGHRAPEIVGFGSSVGFDEAYCKKHPTLKQLCKDYKK
jgi:hypothetical protein